MIAIRQVLGDPAQGIGQSRSKQPIKNDRRPGLLPRQILLDRSGLLQQYLALLLLHPHRHQQLAQFNGMQLRGIHQLAQQQLQLGGRLVGRHGGLQPITALVALKRRRLAGLCRPADGAALSCSRHGTSAACPAA